MTVSSFDSFFFCKTPENKIIRDLDQLFQLLARYNFNFTELWSVYNGNVFESVNYLCIENIHLYYFQEPKNLKAAIHIEIKLNLIRLDQIKLSMIRQNTVVTIHFFGGEAVGRQNCLSINGFVAKLHRNFNPSSQTIGIFSYH